MENVERLGFRALIMENVDRLSFLICWAFLDLSSHFWKDFPLYEFPLNFN